MARKIIQGVILDDRLYLTLAELSRASTRHAEWIIELVDEGILEPQGREPGDWRFPAESLTRAHKAMRIQRDLQVNIAGVALVLELKDQLDVLRARLRRIEHSGNGDRFHKPG